MENRGKILVIDDDRTLLGLLRQSLEKAGYRFIGVTNGIDGLQSVYKDQPDLVILDVMMPRMDGWETCLRIREVSQVPIIMLTAKEEEADKVKGFECGADDYVTKPFSFAELTARVGAVLHRARRGKPTEAPRVYIFDELVVDVDHKEVSVRGQPVDLTPTEFELLVCLAENAGRTLTHEQLLARVWGDDYFDTGYVKRYIWYLRRKIERDPSNPEYIITERGFGYRLGD
ncbi:MAG: response regulator transcription factor [Anaerolineae bacterium]